MKRLHHNNNNNTNNNNINKGGGGSPTEEGQTMLIENCSPMHTASLGRHKLI